MEEQATNTERAKGDCKMSMFHNWNWGATGVLIGFTLLIISVFAANNFTRVELKNDFRREVGHILKDNAEIKAEIRALSDNRDSRLDAVEQNQASLERLQQRLADLLTAQPPEGNGR